LLGVLSSILAIFPDFISDFINNNFLKIKENIIKIYSSGKDYLAKLIDSIFDPKIEDKGSDSTIKNDKSSGITRDKNTQGPSGWKVNPKDESIDSLRETYQKNRNNTESYWPSTFQIACAVGLCVLILGVYYYWSRKRGIS